MNIVCDCASGFRGVFACPELTAIPCSRYRAGDDGGGMLPPDETFIDPQQLCDGEQDCPDGVDEQGCSGFDLQLIEGDNGRDSATFPYGNDDNCTSCIHRVAGSVERGVLRLVSMRNDGTGPCDGCERTGGFILSESRGLGESVTFSGIIISR